MKVSPHFRQGIILFSLTILTILGTHWTYITFNQKWIKYHEAQELFQESDWQAAAKVYEESISLGLDYPKAFLNLAKAYNYQNNFPLALHWYKRYLTLVPEDFWTRKEYAGLLVATGKFNEAQAEYQTILRDEKP